LAATFDGTAVVLTWQDNTHNETGFKLERSEADNQNFAELAVLPANATTYADATAGMDKMYVYRLRAYNQDGNTSYSNQARAVVSNAALVKMSTQNVTLCSGIFTDNGGNSFTDSGGLGLYTDGQSHVMTLTPQTPGAKIRVSFFEFGTETYNDLLRVYDGSTTSAPLIGTYSGFTLPPALTATNPTGQLTFGFSSNAYVVSAGWSAFVSCYSAVPLAPGGLTATATDASTIDLQWVDHAGDETGYEVYRSDGSADSYRRVAQLAAGAAAYQDAGLTGNTRYWYKVRAINAAESSAFSNEADASTLPLPPTPPAGLLAAAQSATEIQLNWQDASDNETGFSLQYASPNADFIPLATVAAGVTSFAATGLLPGTTYTFRVRALNGPVFSSYSNEASATTLPNPPEAPAVLAAMTASESRIDLQWRGTDASTPFRVFRSGGNGEDFVEIGQTPAGVYTYQDLNLAPVTAYTYRVLAENAGGLSLPSNEVTAVTLQAWPAAPAALTLGAVTSGSVALTWKDMATNETGYLLERSEGTDNNFIQVAQLGVGAESFSNTGLTPATGYYYRVCALNERGKSPYSEVVWTLTAATVSVPDTTKPITPPPPDTTKPAIPLPRQPENVRATPVSTTQIDVTWTPAAGEGFVLERSSGDNAAYRVIASLPVSTTFYSDTNRTASTRYYYRIKTIDGAGSSPYSAEVSAVTSGYGSLNAAVSTYPNPTQGSVTLVVNTPVAETVVVKLANVTGGLLQNYTLPKGSEKLTYPIQLASYPAGIYYISVMTGSGTATKAVFKQ
jgi:titin